MIDKSPFSVATPIAAPAGPVAPPAPSFTQDLYVVGLAKLGSKDFVSIASKDQTQRFSLLLGEQGPDGITVASIARDPGLAKSKVTLKKGTEFGTIGFDETALTATPPEGGQPPGVPPPRPAGMQANMAHPNRTFKPPTPTVNRMQTTRPVVPNVRPFRPAGMMQPNLPQSRVRRPVIPSPR